MTRLHKQLAHVSLPLVLAGAASVAAAQGDAAGRTAPPLWEAGLAAGVGRLADYPGADESHWRGIAVPWFVYRGPVLRIDERGIRGRFVDTARWEFDLTASAAFNARSNDLRSGMPELDYLFGIGPQLVYKGWQAEGGPSVHLKLRAIQSTDFERIDSRGGTVSTELRWRWPGVAGPGSALIAGIEPTWASRPLQRYFYEVSPAQATPTRPAYEARAGYLGTDFTLTLRRRIDGELAWYVGADLTSLHGAANRASPLLAARSNVAFGAWLVWTPWRSGASAQD
jgi:outer membrane scaffolding protein for murein synthesis (MipA/OmpV family)